MKHKFIFHFFIINREALMIGAIQRKMIAGILFILMVPSCMQAMIISTSQARIASGGFGFLASLSALALSKGKDNIGVSISTGAICAGGVYWLLAKLTPEHVKFEVQKTIDEMKLTGLHSLVDHISIEEKESIEKSKSNIAKDNISLNTIKGGYTGAYYLAEGHQDIKKFLLCMRKHSLQCDRAGLTQEKAAVDTVINEMESINREIKNTGLLEAHIALQSAQLDNDVKQSNINNEEKKVSIEDKKVNIQRSEIAFRIGKWIFWIGITFPIWSRLFAWSSKIPYPSYR